VCNLRSSSRRPETSIVSIMAVNNEIGTFQPVNFQGTAVWSTLLARPCCFKRCEQISCIGESGNRFVSCVSPSPTLLCQARNHFHNQANPHPNSRANSHTISNSPQNAHANARTNCRPMAEIGALCRSKKVFFHTDGAQVGGTLAQPICLRLSCRDSCFHAEVARSLAIGRCVHRSAV
jgi:hypothetical protein